MDDYNIFSNFVENIGKECLQFHGLAYVLRTFTFPSMSRV